MNQILTDEELEHAELVRERLPKAMERCRVIVRMFSMHDRDLTVHQQMLVHSLCGAYLQGDDADIVDLVAAFDETLGGAT